MQNKEKIAIYQKLYSQTLKRKKSLKEYREAHKKQIKIYQLNNREKLLNYYKNHYQKNKKRKKEYRQKIYVKNRYNNYIKNKIKNDINFKLKNLIRIRILRALKNNQKSGKTLILLGCTIPELKIHLEKSFKIGMTWENHGKWHIDHIKPCASFDLSKIENQQKCFHYTNLQALWAIENIKKSDNY